MWVTILVLTNSIKMSSKYVPVYEPLSNDPPNEADKLIDKTLFEFMTNEMLH